jgi:hypothetical protein
MNAKLIDWPRWRAATMTDRAIAVKLKEMHQHHPTHNPQVSHYDEIGVGAERHFAKEFDCFFDEVRACNLPNGDGGIDFDYWKDVPGVGTIDVKGANYKREFLVEAKGELKADIYVMCAAFDDQGPEWRYKLWGWVYRDEVLRYAPQRHPRQILNHVVPIADLRCIKTLHTRIDAVDIRKGS